MTEQQPLPNQDQVTAAVLEHAKLSEPCILCGKKTHDRGVWIPNNNQLGKPLTGKVRCGIYPVCRSHTPLTDRATAVIEKKLMKKLGQRYWEQ
jgi:hypothetical protein